MEREQLPAKQKNELVRRTRRTRRGFIGLVLGLSGIAAATSVATILEMSDQPKPLPTPSLGGLATPTLELLIKKARSPAPETPVSTAPPPIPPQEKPILPETPLNRKEIFLDKRFTRGNINFADEQSPLGIAYPENWEQTKMVELKNLKILLSDEEEKNLQIFDSRYGGKVFVYPELLSDSFVLNIHDGYYVPTNLLLEAEPLRQLIEGNLKNPYPEEVIKKNLEKIIGFPFFCSQKGQTSRFVITSAKRMNAHQTQEYDRKSGELSRVLGQITDPENSFLMITCSARQPGEPNEVLPGRFVFALKYSP